MLTTVRYVSTGERSQTRIVAVGSHHSLSRLENSLKANCGDTTRQVTSRDITNALIEKSFYVSQLPPMAAEDLRILINQSLEDPQPRNAIVWSLPRQIPQDSPLTSQETDLNMQICSQISRLHLSLLYSPQILKEKDSLHRQDEKESSVQRPTETPAVQIVRSAPSMTESTLSVSQHTEARNPQLTTTYETAIYTCPRGCNVVFDEAPLPGAHCPVCGWEFTDESEYERHTVYVCATCYSPRIELTAWVNANTDEITQVGADGPREVCWCNVCHEESTCWDEVEITALTLEDAIRIQEERRTGSFVAS